MILANSPCDFLLSDAISFLQLLFLFPGACPRASTSQLLLYCFRIKIIGPPLHHLLAFRQVLGVVICRSDSIPLRVSKLAFNHIRSEAMFVQDGAGGTAEAVAGSA